MINPFESILEKINALEEKLNLLIERSETKETFSDFPEMLTREQAGQILNVKLPTLDHWVREKKVEKLREGKIVRFRKSDILQLLKANVKYQRN